MLPTATLGTTARPSLVRRSAGGGVGSSSPAAERSARANSPALW
ncbi:MAG: hypothetical protein U0Z44_05335 [Kouleothrix sp.]